LLLLLVAVCVAAVAWAYRRRVPATFEASVASGGAVDPIAVLNVVLLAVNLTGGWEYWKSAASFVLVDGLSFEACSLHSSYFGPWVFLFVLSKVFGDLANLFVRLRASSSPSMRPTLGYIFPRLSNMIVCYLAWAFRVPWFGLFAGLSYVDDGVLYLFYVLQRRLQLHSSARAVAVVQWSHVVKQLLVLALLVHNTLLCNWAPLVTELTALIVLLQLALHARFMAATVVPTRLKVA